VAGGGGGAGVNLGKQTPMGIRRQAVAIQTNFLAGALALRVELTPALLRLTQKASRDGSRSRSSANSKCPAQP